MTFGWTDTYGPILLYTGLFLLLHVLAVWRVAPTYTRAFKLSRGGAALILTLLGVSALVGGFGHWREAFLYRHGPDDWMRTGLLAVCGHLIADFIWMAVGKVRYGIKPRMDLIIHHGLGLVGFGAALVLQIGYALALLTMITELMPLTTGINAWGKHIAVSRVVDAADKARLHVLAWLRIPLWSTLLVLVVMSLARGPEGGLLVAYLVAAAGLMGLISLDFFWIGKARQRVDFY